MKVPQKIEEWNEDLLNEIIEGVHDETVELEYLSFFDPKNLDQKDRDIIERKACSFANSQGGSIVFGIKEIREGNQLIKLEVVGVPDVNNLSIRFANSFSRTTPRINHEFLTHLLNYEDKKILVCYISKSKETIESKEGIYYHRIGSSSERMSRDQIKTRFIIEDIEKIRIKAFLMEAKQMLDVIEDLKRKGINTSSQIPPFYMFNVDELKKSIKENYKIYIEKGLQRDIFNLFEQLHDLVSKEKQFQYFGLPEIIDYSGSGGNFNHAFQDHCKKYNGLIYGQLENLKKYLSKIKDYVEENF